MIDWIQWHPQEFLYRMGCIVAVILGFMTGRLLLAWLKGPSNDDDEYFTQ